jgi:tetratricopeptide (TPR) repeat protein
MSLLMDALKKAERAKQAAQEKAAAQGSEPAPAELQLSPDEPGPAESTPAEATATDEAPAPGTAWSAPHPLLRDPRQARLDFPKLELESIDDREFDLDPVPPRPGKDAGGAAEARSRATARSVFEAKQPDHFGRSRVPLIAGVCAIILVLGVGGYFMIQMRGGSSLAGPQLASGPLANRPGVPVAVAQPAPATQFAANAGTQPPIPAAPTLPAASAVLPDTGGTARETATPPARKFSAPLQPGSRMEPGTRARLQSLAPSSAASRSQEPVLGEVRVSPSAVSVNPVLNAAYSAYAANDLAAARNGYTAVLERDPANRDALLGLAGIAAREQHNDEAENLYLRILHADPTDAYAQTGLISIRSTADPVAAESRLKTLLASQPESAFLHYALGNLYAKQRRWNDAEQEQFRALALDGDNADYCYNLAVSLDQMRQPRQALTHYQRALALAAVRPASFDPDRLRARISELQQ